MDDTTNVPKRLFYLEQSLKKVWKEFKRLKSIIQPEGEFENKPFENLKED
jgi:hypothetical protein